MSTERIAGPQPSDTEPLAHDSANAPIASQRPASDAVPGKPWLVRDAHGIFRAASPAGSDPAVAADVASFEAGIASSYPHSSPALRLMAVRCFAMFRRYERAGELSPPRPGARIPAIVREAGAWLDRLTRIAESLEASNTGKRRGAPQNPRAALEELQRQAAARRQS